MLKNLYQRNKRGKKPRNQRRHKTMKQKPKKTTKQENESIPDREHDEKKDLSFFSFPSSVKKEREEYGHYEQPNY